MSIYLKKHSIIFSTLQKEERKTNVKVEIENHSSGLSIKELLIRLTDEEEMSFLFCLKINQDNYQEIKSQQGLLIDFSSFGQKLIDLFNMCSEEEGSECPKYVLKLIGNGDVPNISIPTAHWTLNFVETNPFKHLTHLSLRLCHGDSETFKNYLIESLKKMMTDNCSLSSKLASTESCLNQKLQHSDSCLSEAKSNYQQLQVSSKVQLEDLRAKLEELNRNNKEKLVETESYYVSKSDQEKRDLENNFSKSIRSLEMKVQELERTNKCLCDENSKLEGDIRDGKNRFDALDESYRQSGLDVQSRSTFDQSTVFHSPIGLRRSREQFDRTVHDLECQIQKLTTRVAVLDQEVRDKDMLASKNQEMYVSEQETRIRYQEESAKRAKQVEKLDKVVKNLNEEVSKGNDIIQKLQSEVKHYHAKIKVRNQITSEQEKVINERDLEMKKLSNEMDNLQRQLTQRDEDCQKTSTSLEQVSKKLEEANHVIKTNENVINWLNRQVTEYELMKQKSGLSSQPQRTQQTNQFFANPSEQLLKYRPASSISTVGSGDNYSSSILSGLKTKDKFMSGSTTHNQMTAGNSLATGSEHCSSVTKNLDNNVISNPSLNRDARYIGKSIVTTGPLCSSELSSYGLSKANTVRIMHLGNATPIIEEPEAACDQQQSLSSAYFPRPLLGPR